MAHSERTENKIVGSMLLMSTVSAAADVLCGMVERRQGCDPSSQETPDVALANLRTAADELDEHLIALRAGRILQEGDEQIRIARSVNEMLILTRITRLVHTVHQRLLSLYPSVSEELVEAARLLEAAFADERDRVGARRSPGLIDAAGAFCARLRTPS